MKKNTDDTISSESINRVAGISQNLVTIGAASPVGIITASFPSSPATELIPVETAAAAVVATHGECSVKTSTCVAGDWFTSDAAGLAVKTETGFALGRILQNPVDGLALCVVSPIML